jgi:hypothetical protein
MPRDLDKALSDILAIRSQIAAGSSFQGYGPTAVAVSGALALVTTILQSLWADPSDPVTFLAAWFVTAMLSAAAIGFEMRARARRHHSGLADEMIYAAVQNFLPAGAAGALMALIILRLAPESAWMIPGLWQVLVGIGAFASAQTSRTACSMWRPGISLPEWWSWSCAATGVGCPHGPWAFPSSLASWPWPACCTRHRSA